MLTVAVHLLAVRMLLVIVPFRWWATYLARLSRRQALSSQTVVEASHLAAAVQRISRYIPRATCLTQALTTRVLLARWQQPALIHIGVRIPTEQPLEAHAWVALGEDILIGNRPDLARFTLLYSL